MWSGAKNEQQMSLKSWAGEILLECKRILGIDHASSEQEVHEGLRAMKTAEDIEAGIRKEYAGKVEQFEKLEIQHKESLAENVTLQNQITALEQERDKLQETVSDLESKVEAGATALQAANDKIEEMKNALQDTHTGGESGDGSGKAKSGRAWEANPINKRYLDRQAKQ